MILPSAETPDPCCPNPALPNLPCYSEKALVKASNSESFLKVQAMSDGILCEDHGILVGTLCDCLPASLHKAVPAAELLTMAEASAKSAPL